jgi:KaiC/GvpD/RAD55 family RecA-like ATPase
MKRIKTGILGLDELLEGGFPSPSSILVTGPVGSGKSIFGLQFLYKGAKEYDEPGIMISVEGYPTDFQWNQEKFHWDLKDLQDAGKLIFSRYDPVDFEKFELRTLHSEIIMQLSKIIDSIGAKRIVIDNINPIAQHIGEPSTFRTILYYLSKALKEKDCTVLFITEKPVGEEKLTYFDVEPHVVDGVIELLPITRGETTVFSLSIKKMIATDIPSGRFIADISNEGFKLVTSYY